MRMEGRGRWEGGGQGAAARGRAGQGPAGRAWGHRGEGDWGRDTGTGGLDAQTLSGWPPRPREAPSKPTAPSKLPVPGSLSPPPTPPPLPLPLPPSPTLPPKTGGVLLLATPFTWLEDYTPKGQWLGGTVRDGAAVRSADALAAAVAADFDVLAEDTMPLLIAEHARKHQLLLTHRMVLQRK